MAGLVPAIFFMPGRNAGLTLFPGKDTLFPGKKVRAMGFTPRFPPPLRGRDREGGKPHAPRPRPTPRPNPPPQGGREQAECAAIFMQSGSAEGRCRTRNVSSHCVAAIAARAHADARPRRRARGPCSSLSLENPRGMERRAALGILLSVPCDTDRAAWRAAHAFRRSIAAFVFPGRALRENHFFVENVFSVSPSASSWQGAVIPGRSPGRLRGD